MMNNDHTATIGLVVDMILTNVDQVVDANQPFVSMDPDDKPCTEDSLGSIEMSLPDFSDRMIRHIGNLLEDYGYKSFTDINIMSNDRSWNIDVRYFFGIGRVSKAANHKTLLISIYWDEHAHLLRGPDDGEG